jgi:diazepam-binding inhibitor (GABA receptor modulator, acyl-CoA-binding protein)
MTDIKDTFEKAVIESKELPSRPDNETLLMIYSLYKQATEGDIDPENKPGMFDFVAKAKYDAWSSLKGVSAEDAMGKYIDLIAELSSKKG